MAIPKTIKQNGRMIQTPTSGYILKEVKAVTQAAILQKMFISVLFMIVKR